jgi:hypothetical protein
LPGPLATHTDPRIANGRIQNHKEDRYAVNQEAQREEEKDWKADLLYSFVRLRAPLWLNFLIFFVISPSSPPDYKPCLRGHLNVVQGVVCNRGLTHYPIPKEEMQDDEKVSMGALL